MKKMTLQRSVQLIEPLADVHVCQVTSMSLTTVVKDQRSRDFYRWGNHTLDPFPGGIETSPFQGKIVKVKWANKV
jgi:hypothetical protein